MRMNSLLLTTYYLLLTLRMRMNSSCAMGLLSTW